MFWPVVSANVTRNFERSSLLMKPCSLLKLLSVSCMPSLIPRPCPGRLASLRNSQNSENSSSPFLLSSTSMMRSRSFFGLGSKPSLRKSAWISSASIVPLPSVSKRLKSVCSSSIRSVAELTRGLAPDEPWRLRSKLAVEACDARLASPGGSCFAFGERAPALPLESSRALMMSSTCHMAVSRFCATCCLRRCCAVLRSTLPPIVPLRAIHSCSSASSGLRRFKGSGSNSLMTRSFA
mmetsp:Transcript_5036/g.13281  ORF Transcript_5036/g.13281 Transcript_5036/m.13281 type:complete len:237 (+) Transcript_5036:746-1456(+)